MIKARLFGPTIVSVDMQELSSTHFRATYTVHDEGEYFLQIRLVWLSGADMDYDAFLNIGELDAKSMYLDCTVYNASVAIHGVQEASLHRAAKPLCTRGDLPGRWVRTNAHGVFPHWACDTGEEAPALLTDRHAEPHIPSIHPGASGAAWVNDLFSFNRDYVW